MVCTSAVSRSCMQTSFIFFSFFFFFLLTSVIMRAGLGRRHATIYVPYAAPRGEPYFLSLFQSRSMSMYVNTEIHLYTLSHRAAHSLPVGWRGCHACRCVSHSIAGSPVPELEIFRSQVLSHEDTHAYSREKNVEGRSHGTRVLNT